MKRQESTDSDNKKNDTQERNQSRKQDRDSLRKALKQAKFTTVDKVLLVVVIALAVALVVVAVLFARKLGNELTAQREYGELGGYIGVPAAPGGTDQPGGPGSGEPSDEASSEKADALSEIPFPELEIDYAALRAENPDFAGVLYIPALDLTYPVAAAPDNSYYLGHTFRGQRSSAGAIFLDADCAADFGDRNSIVYGHNMRNGTMFGSLQNFYREEGLAESAPYIYLYREDGVRRYRIFSCYVADADSEAFQLLPEDADTDYDNYVEGAQRKSFLSLAKDGSAIDFAARPCLLTLATCSGRAGTTKRLVVHAALTEVSIM